MLDSQLCALQDYVPTNKIVEQLFGGYVVDKNTQQLLYFTEVK